MLVSALPEENVLNAYNKAVEENAVFSFGDAMFMRIASYEKYAVKRN